MNTAFLWEAESPSGATTERHVQCAPDRRMRRKSPVQKDGFCREVRQQATREVILQNPQYPSGDKTKRKDAANQFKQLKLKVPNNCLRLHRGKATNLNFTANFKRSPKMHCVGAPVGKIRTHQLINSVSNFTGFGL